MTCDGSGGVEVAGEGERERVDGAGEGGEGGSRC